MSHALKLIQNGIYREYLFLKYIPLKIMIKTRIFKFKFKLLSMFRFNF